MASSNPFLSASLSLVCLFLLFFLLLSFEKKSFTSGIGEEPTGLQHTHHNVRLSSLFPSSSCTSPPQGATKRGSLEVVHRHGPCSKLKQHISSSSSSVKMKAPLMIPHSEILKRDEARVRSIHSKLSKTHKHEQQKEATEEASSEGLGQLPVTSDNLLGTGDYLVTVGLGTPTRELSLIFDTATDITWTQCEPCTYSCYDQKEPIFDPSQSSSFSNISCSLCDQLQLFYIEGCSVFGCIYAVLREDDYNYAYASFGFFAKETLTVTPTDVVDNFMFGCGQFSKVLFDGSAAGVLGLGLGPKSISFVQQTADKFHKVFSYCIPSTSSAVGYLTFGNINAPTSGSINYIPLSPITVNGPPFYDAKVTGIVEVNTPFYGINIAGIALSGTNLSISPAVFDSHMIIDSGNVITWLPPSAYGPLRDAFRNAMSMYPEVDPEVPILDTCYDLSGYKNVVVPRVTLWFEGGVNVELDASGILYAVSETQVCLAFAANNDDSDVAILGNAQQKTLEVVYDVGGGKIGFRPGGCN